MTRSYSDAIDSYTWYARDVPLDDALAVRLRHWLPTAAAEQAEVAADHSMPGFLQEAYQMRADIAAVAGHKDLHPIFPLLAGARIAETRRQVGSNTQRLGFLTQGAFPESHNFVKYS